MWPLLIPHMTPNRERTKWSKALLQLRSSIERILTFSDSFLLDTMRPLYATEFSWCFFFLSPIPDLGFLESSLEAEKLPECCTNTNTQYQKFLLLRNVIIQILQSFLRTFHFESPVEAFILSTFGKFKRCSSINWMSQSPTEIWNEKACITSLSHSSRVWRNKANCILIPNGEWNPPCIWRTDGI